MARFKLKLLYNSITQEVTMLFSKKVKEGWKCNGKVSCIILSVVISVASAVTYFTPTDVDNKVLSAILRVLDTAALNN